MAITNATPNTATSMTTGQMAVFNATQTFGSAVVATDEDILFTQHCVFSAGGTFTRCGVVFNLPNDTVNVRNKACTYVSSKIRFASGGNWNKVALSTLTNCVITGSGQSTLFPFLSGTSAWNNVVLASTGQIVFDTDAVVSAFNGVQLIDNNGGFWKQATTAITAYGLVFSGTTPASMWVSAGANDSVLINSYTVLFARTRINSGSGRIIYRATRNILTAASANVAAWDKNTAVVYQATASGAGIVPEIAVTTHYANTWTNGSLGTVVYDDKLVGSGYTEILYKYGFGLVRNDVTDYLALRLGTPAPQNGGAAVSIPVPLTADAYVTASEATAAAMNAVKFSKSGATVTVLAAATLDELYDWLHWRTRQDIPAIVRPSIGGVLTVAENATASGSVITLAGLSLIANATLSAGTKLATLSTSGTVTTNGNVPIGYTDASGTYAMVTVSGLVAGSRVQVYNVTTATELYNGIVAGTSLSFLTAYAGAATIRLRATYLSGLSCKAPYETSNTIGVNGVAFSVVQGDCPVYTAYGIDGSLVTGFAADHVNDDIDLTLGTNFYISELFAWWAYILTTAEGISDFFGGITPVDEGNIQINDDIVNIQLDNFTASDVWALDNRRLFRKDGARPIKNPTTGGGGIDVEWREKVLFVNSAEVAAIKAKTDLLPADPASNTQVNTRLAESAYVAPANADIAVMSGTLIDVGIDVAAIKAKTDALPAAPAAVADVQAVGSAVAAIPAAPTAAANAAAVRSNLATELGRIDVASSSLMTAAAYVAPANAAITAIKAKTDNLPAAPAAVSDVQSVGAAVAALSIPSAAETAAAVRVELAAELARVDVPSSSLLAAADYTAPDNAGIAALAIAADNLTATVVANAWASA